MPNVADFIDELGEFLQLAQRRGWQTGLIELEHQVRDDAGEIAIARPLAVAIDCALHLGSARLNGGQGVGHAQADVVVGVNADRGG